MSGTPCTLKFGPRAASKLELMGIRFIDDGGDGSGAGYVPPATQEDLNRIVVDRVNRAKSATRAEVEAEYSQYSGVDLEALRRDSADLAQLRSQQGSGDPVQRPEDAATIATLQASLDRFTVAADNGIPLAHAPRLIGSTKEELDADAKQYRASLRLGGYVPGQGEQDGAPHAGAQGKAEADRRFGNRT